MTSMKNILCALLLSLAALSAAAPSSGYPLTTCVVSGEKLGSMGEPVVIHTQGREVRLCCEHCLPKFEKSPGEFLRKLDGTGQTGN